MPNRKKADLIIHPVRLEILQALSARPLSTQEIAQVVPEVSVPSLYRHLKMLLEGNLVEVVETRSVRAIPEKIYRLSQVPKLSAEDVSGMTPDDLVKYFTSYVASLLQSFSAYAHQDGKSPNMAVDSTGFTETYFYASSAEMDDFQNKLIEIIKEIVAREPEKGRLRRKLAIITHPIS